MSRRKGRRGGGGSEGHLVEETDVKSSETLHTSLGGSAEPCNIRHFKYKHRGPEFVGKSPNEVIVLLLLVFSSHLF